MTNNTTQRPYFASSIKAKVAFDHNAVTNMLLHIAVGERTRTIRLESLFVQPETETASAVVTFLLRAEKPGKVSNICVPLTKAVPPA